MKLSIITVSYNAEETIEKTLKSVEANKTKDIEYIVIDGKSTDYTIDILKKYEKIIDVLVSEKDAGIYDALNKGIKRSSGDYIMFLAADDVLIDRALNQVFSTINKDTDIWAGGIIHKNAFGYFYEYSSKNLEELKWHCSLRNPASLFKREIFSKYGYYDTKLKCDGDRELFLRMYLKGVKFQIEDMPIVVFNTGGISTGNRINYAIPEGKQISINYGMDVETAETYYSKMIQRENLKQKINNQILLRKLALIAYSDFFYPFVCKLSGRTNYKLKKKELVKYGLIK